MVKILIFGSVIAVTFTLYALVDAAMSDNSRARGVSKPIWVLIVAILPVIGALLWFTIGKGSHPTRTTKTPAAKAPDDDPRFSGTRMSEADLNKHLQDLEARLRELDNEKFPGEEGGPPTTGTHTGSEESTTHDKSTHNGTDTSHPGEQSPPPSPHTPPHGNTTPGASHHPAPQHEPGDNTGPAAT